MEAENRADELEIIQVLSFELVVDPWGCIKCPLCGIPTEKGIAEEHIENCRGR